MEHFDGSAWHAVPSPDPGVSGNHLYGVAAVSPTDVWAVGEQLGSGGFDRPLIEHWDGSAWHLVPAASTPNASSMLFSVSAWNDRVFAAGQTEGAANGAHPLVEALGTTSATIVNLPDAGTRWTELWGISVTSSHVWAAGTYVDGVSGNNETLIFEGDLDGSWHVVDAPNPGSGSNILGGIASAGSSELAVGVFDNGGNARPLVVRDPPS